MRRCIVITLNSQHSNNHSKSKIGPRSKIHSASKINRQSGTTSASKTNPTFDRARKQIGSLSNKKLLSDLEKINQRERRLKVLVLLYLSEIDTRRLYLPLGYSSLFDFCTAHLGYPRATAARRIRSARAAARYPEALDMILSGEINTTTLAMVGDILDRDNYINILSEIRGRSTREVELLVSQHRPVNTIRDTVRPVCVMRRIEKSQAPAGTSAETNSRHFNAPVDEGRCGAGGGVGPGAGTGLGNIHAPTGDGRPGFSPSAGTKISNPDPEGGGMSSTATCESSPSAETKIILGQRLKLGFTVSPEFINKYNKIKSLLSNRYPGGINFETLFEHIMNEYLDKHDPERRHVMRAKRAENNNKSMQCEPGRSRALSPERAENRGEPAKRGPEKRLARRAGKRRKACKREPRDKISDSRDNSRRIPPAVRDQVYARDKGRCSFIGANGKRCGSKWDLELDHVVPFARGGDNSPGNLRFLCRKHNMHEAERAYGREFMNIHIKK
jgi:5-methylcytosine-specific restriction endonuclease McrA